MQAITWTDKLEAIAAAVAAVGTVGAILVALFGQPWLERRRRPRLHLSLGRDVNGYGDAGGGDDDYVATTTMRVTAEPGRRSAEDVEVLLTATWRRDDLPIDVRTQPSTIVRSRGSKVSVRKGA